jgi:hypothetical protein
MFNLKDRKIIKRNLVLNHLRDTLPTGTDEAQSKIVFGTLSKRARKKIEELVGIKPFASDMMTIAWNEIYGVSITIKNSGADTWYCGADVKDWFLDLMQLRIERSERA